MRIGIAFGMAVWAAMWNEAIHESFDVCGYIGICVFIDGHCCSGVGDVKVASSLLNPRRIDEGLNFPSDIHELSAAVCADSKAFAFRHDERNRNTRGKREIKA